MKLIEQFSVTKSPKEVFDYIAVNTLKTMGNSILKSTA